METAEKRFMLDTSALNRIIKSPDDEMLIIKSKAEGCQYFFADIQFDEIAKIIRRPSPGVPRELVERTRVYWMLDLLKTMLRIQTHYVKRYATLKLNDWILDDGLYIMPDEVSDAHDDIYHRNDQHFNDAMIGTVAMEHGCVLVTEDRRLFNRVNAHTPGGAIRYADFIARLTGDSTSAQ